LPKTTKINITKKVDFLTVYSPEIQLVERGYFEGINLNVVLFNSGDIKKLELSWRIGRQLRDFNALSDQSGGIQVGTSKETIRIVNQRKIK